MSTTGGPGAPVPESEALIHRVATMIAGARALPLSSSVKLDNKDELLELLREASERLPEELRQARWMLKEREEFLAATQRQGEELVEAARSEAQRLVQRTEILKEAQTQSRRTIEQAREQSRRMRMEAEDYADQKLAQFEIVLERTMKTVASGRQKLSGLPERDEDVAPGTAESTGRPYAWGSPADVPGISGLSPARPGPRPPADLGHGGPGAPGGPRSPGGAPGSPGTPGSPGGPRSPGGAPGSPGALVSPGGPRRPPSSFLGMITAPEEPDNASWADEGLFDQDTLD